MMYVFCSNNVLYSASFSFTIFIFLLILFDTCDCYYFKSYLSLLMYIKMLLIKKTCNTVLQPSKCEDSTFPHAFIFVLIPYSIGVIKSKECCQKWEGGREKDVKEGVRKKI